MKLLTVQNAKTIKGEKKGYLTGILYLAPANVSGHNMCPMATAGCKDSCLFTAGRGVFPQVMNARIRKTHQLQFEPEKFKAQLIKDINLLVDRAAHRNMIPAIRINGTSDQPKLALEMAARFPNVQFYDYTKISRPWKRRRNNYHLTFSRSECNWKDCNEALQHGINVAVVFEGKSLPKRFNGYRVVDGDQHDLRFLDPKGIIVGLRAKGRARKDNSGFVVLQ